MVKFLITMIAAIWICAIALIAAQNGTRVVIQFLGIQSIQIPFGLLLAACVALGMIGAALLLPFFSSAKPSLRDREDFE